MRSTLAMLLLTLAGSAASATPTYDVFELAARANFSGSFNTSNGALFSNTTPALSDTAGVAATTSGGIEAVWYDPGPVGMNGNLDFVSNGFLGDASLNENGQIVTSQSFSAQDGVILIDSGVAAPAFSLNLFSVYSSPQINDSGRIGYRAQTGSGAQLYASDDIGGGLSPVIHVAEVGVQPASPYSFLFTPSFNNADQIAGKARVGGPGQTGGSQPDEIRVWNLDGSSTLIAEDADANPASPFASFDNSVSLTDSGWVAFTSTLTTGQRAVFLGDGTTTIEIGSEADAAISDIEFFSPAANDGGLVAFRAFNATGLRAIFVGDGTKLLELITENDLLETDLGTARLDQETASSPVFGGGPAINDAGDVAFFAGVTPPENNQIEWGTALFIARATAANPADLDGDGSVGSGDLGILLAAWGSAGGAADLDGDGVVGSGDLGILLAAWG